MAPHFLAKLRKYYCMYRKYLKKKKQFCICCDNQKKTLHGVQQIDKKWSANICICILDNKICKANMLLISWQSTVVRM